MIHFRVAAGRRSLAQVAARKDCGPSRLRAGFRVAGHSSESAALVRREGRPERACFKQVSETRNHFDLLLSGQDFWLSCATYLAFFSCPHRQALSENIQSRARLARAPYGGCSANWIDEIRPCWNTGLSFEKVRKPS